MSRPEFTFVAVKQNSRSHIRQDKRVVPRRAQQFLPSLREERPVHSADTVLVENDNDRSPADVPGCQGLCPAVVAPQCEVGDNAMKGEGLEVRFSRNFVCFLVRRTTFCMTTRWFYKLMGEELGPVSTIQLRELLHNGTLLPDTHIREANGDWVTADTLLGEGSAEVDRVETSAIIANCENCGQSYTVPSNLEGRSATCKKCGKTFKICTDQRDSDEAADEPDGYQLKDDERCSVPEELPPTAQQPGAAVSLHPTASRAQEETHGRTDDDEDVVGSTAQKILVVVLPLIGITIAFFAGALFGDLVPHPQNNLGLFTGLPSFLLVFFAVISLAAYLGCFALAITNVCENAVQCILLALVPGYWIYCAVTRWGDFEEWYKRIIAVTLLMIFFFAAVEVADIANAIPFSYQASLLDSQNGLYFEREHATSLTAKDRLRNWPEPLFDQETWLKKDYMARNAWRYAVAAYPNVYYEPENATREEKLRGIDFSRHPSNNVLPGVTTVGWYSWLRLSRRERNWQRFWVAIKPHESREIVEWNLKEEAAIAWDKGQYGLVAHSPELESGSD